MTNNPEFQRNLWLELSRHRLVSMPAVLGAIFFLVYLVAKPLYAEPINTSATILFFLLTLLWGTRLAGDALINEIRDHTWDQQRMTSIPPWSMTWGKLFGSTIFIWYGAAFCLIAYVLTAPQLQLIDTLKNVIIMIAIGVLAHSVALLVSLQSVTKKRELNRTSSTSFMIIGIVAAFPFISLGLENNNYISWYGIDYQQKDFYLVSLLCFCAWLLIGIFRYMRSELQFRSYPLVWLGFLAFFTLYITGLVDNTIFEPQQLHTLRLFVAFVSLMSLTYVMILLESKDPLLIKRMVMALSSRNWRGLLEHTPNWLVTLVCVYILCPFLIMADYSQLDTLTITSEWIIDFNHALIATSIFLSRDVLLILYFNFSKDRKRADLTAIMYLAILYWLIPSILGGMGLTGMLPIFFPIGFENSVLSIVSGLLQSALLVVLLVRRYRTI